MEFPKRLINAVQVISDVWKHLQSAPEQIPNMIQRAMNAWY